MTSERYSTGIQGLDAVLHGGLPPGGGYLVRGGPGSGKTTLGLHFLERAAEQAYPALFITLGEPEEQIVRNAEAVGIDTTGMDFLDMSPGAGFFAEEQSFDIFYSEEVEANPLASEIRAEIERSEPARVFIDSLTHFRYLHRDAFQFRKQVLSFVRYLTEQGATVVFTSESGSDAPDDDLAFLADGVINLLNREPERGGRRLEVTKLRGTDFRRGKHSMTLDDDGVGVFPILEVGEAVRPQGIRRLSTGVSELDEMLHGGLELGTTTVISGPTGVGKTTLSLLFLKEMAARGERAVLFTFDEDAATILERADGTGLPLRTMTETGTLEIEKVEPMIHSADSFAQMARAAVEDRGASLVMVDSIGGYRMALAESEDTTAKLHALSRYLTNAGATVVLPLEVEKITGEFQISNMGISYLADNILFLRYLEIDGELRRAIGVLKKRLSNFQKTLREYEITGYGVKVGRPLSHLRGILSGTPRVEPGPEGGGSA